MDFLFPYIGNADFIVLNGVYVPFSYRFRIVSFNAVSKRRLKEKTAFKRRFSFQPITRH